MMAVGTAFDKLFLEHTNGEGHPERPERLETVQSLLDGWSNAEELQPLEPQDAAEAEIGRVHEPHYIEQLKATAGTGRVFDLDTAASPRTYDAAIRAAGTGIAAARAVWERTVWSAFAFLRPPGHHAERNHPMGFCFFNNVAVAAAAARAELGAERVLVLDWDVHHGNGTQHLFEESREVLYISLHQSPLFPGTGAVREIGKGAGEGYTVNIPLPGNSGDAAYRRAFMELIVPVVRAYRPDLMLISAGFDAHRRDPLAGMALDSESFGRMAAVMQALAAELCSSRTLYVLEGGYDLRALSESVTQVLETLCRDAASSGTPVQPESVWPQPETPPSRAADNAIAEALRTHRRHWPDLAQP
jgi:acetoin utilization deacetylase AcuC-like enzyme